MEDKKELLRNLPKVDECIGNLAAEFQNTIPVMLVKLVVQECIDAERQRILRNDDSCRERSNEDWQYFFHCALQKKLQSNLRRIINGTGVGIHTNLGRSLLSKSATQALAQAGSHYTNLEYNLETGKRGSRYSLVESIICELTGAEAALVVNNNAAAVLLVLETLAYGKEAIVSRGQLVEIGGSFRIPDVMKKSGAKLVEVGATNRTHPRDYRGAVTSASGLLLKVHASNFAVVGFTAEVSAPELTEIGRKLSLPVMADVGSGNLIDLPNLPGEGEPTVQAFVSAGVDVVTFSGDKLLGGPQAGIFVGKKAFIDPMKRHPLLRALRVDKMTVAALEGTLRLFRDERKALVEIPVLRMLTVSAAELTARGKRLLRRFSRQLPAGVSLSIVSGMSQVGGGALPLADLPTALIAVHADGFSPDDLERRFRNCLVPVIGRIYKGNFLLDLRTVLDADIPDLLSAFQALAE